MLSMQSFVMDAAMANNLIVRNVDPLIVQALKRAAVEHGRSAEAEHREILRTALLTPKQKSLKEILSKMPDVGLDADFQCSRLQPLP